MTGGWLIRYLGAGLGLLLMVCGTACALAARRGAPFAPSAGVAGMPGWVFVLAGAALLLTGLFLEPGGIQAPLFTR